MNMYLLLLLEFAGFFFGTLLVSIAVLYGVSKAGKIHTKKRAEQLSILIIASILLVFVIVVTGSLLAYDSISTLSEEMLLRYTRLLGTTYEEVYYDMEVVLAEYNQMYSFTIMLVRMVGGVMGGYLSYVWFIKKYKGIQKK